MRLRTCPLTKKFTQVYKRQAVRIYVFVLIIKISHESAIKKFDRLIDLFRRLILKHMNQQTPRFLLSLGILKIIFDSVSFLLCTCIFD